MNKKNLKVIIILLTCIGLFCTVSVNAKESKNSNTHYFEDVYYAGKNDGYSKKESIKQNDPHFGWKLGKFVISGYTSKRTDENNNWIFLKTNGDEITLYFNLLQDIDKLDGNSKLKIADDKNGYDEKFEIKKSDFGRGYLIVRKTDSSGNINTPIKTKNYLEIVKKSKNNKIDVYEEGDYEVALDYEIMEDGFAFFNEYRDYKITFKFSVRNGNCMVYPFDSETGEELQNTSITPNGFYLDLANSQYLSVIVKKEILNDGADGLTEDTRYNRPVKSGEKFTEEGIYTILVKNEYTNETTTKKIYVGNNRILKATVKYNYSIKEINDMKKLGTTIDKDGNLYNIPAKYSKSINDSSENESINIIKYIPIIIPIILALIAIVYYLLKKKRERKNIEKKINEKKINNMSDKEEIYEEKN